MFNTPLRYPGGKGRLTQYIIDVMEMNDLVGRPYVEPYAGGAGIALTLLYLEYASHIHLNDLNSSVFSFWHSVLNKTDELVKLVTDTPITMDEWHHQRAVQADIDASVLERGFSTFFLNRTNRSGIIAAGVIGGKAQAGKWKIDARFNRKDLASRIEKIASYGPRISLHQLDAAAFLQGPLQNIPPGLVYLDPPYYTQGQNLYQNHYKHEDHIAIGKLVSKIPHQWLVSYDNEPAIREIYADFRQETFGLKYSAQRAYEGVEVMVFGPRIKIPGPVTASRADAA